MKVKWKILSLVIMLGLLMPSLAQATDYVNLELLISNHKRQSNRLKDRLGEKALATAQSQDETVKSGRYVDIAKELHKRAGDLLGYVTFGADMVNIASMTARIVEMETKVVNEAVAAGVRYPRLTEDVVFTEIEVGNRLAMVTMYTWYMLVASAGVGLATQEQRVRFVTNIKTSLNEISWMLSDLLFRCKLYKVRGEDLKTRIEDYVNFFDNVQQQVLGRGKKEIDDIFKLD